MAKGAVDRIDSIYDIPALTAQQKSVETLVKKTIDQIKSARAETISFNVNTKTFDEYNKKIKELEKSLFGMQKSSAEATKASVLLEKQKQAEAVTAQKLAQQQLAEIKLREANNKAAESEALAIDKVNTAKSKLSDRPISSIPFTIKTGDLPDPNAANVRVTDLEREKNAIDAAAAAESNYFQEKQKSVEVNNSPAIIKYADDLEKLTGSLGENEDLMKIYKKELSDVQNELKLMDKVTSTSEKSTGKYRNKVADLTATETKLKAEVKDLTATIKNQNLQNTAAAGSLDQLRARYTLLTREIDRGGEVFRKSAIGQKLVLEAGLVQASIKKVEGETGRFQRNVGNYGNAITETFKKMFSGLRTAANLIPGLGMGAIIGFAIAGITSLVGWLSKLGKANDDAARSSKMLSTVTEESSGNIAKESTSLAVLRASIESTKVPMATRLQGIKDLREQYPDYFANLTDEEILLGAVSGAYDLVAESIIRKARASAAASEIDKNEVKKLKLEQEDLADIIETNDRLRKLSISAVIILGQGAFAKRQALRKKEIAEIEADNRFLLGIAVDGAKEVIKIDKVKEETKKTKGKDIVEANRKAQFEILKSQIELDKEFDLIRANDERKSFEERIGNLITYGADSQRLIETQAAFDLATADLTAKEREKIELNKNNALIRLAAELNDKLTKITADSFKVETEALGKSVKGMNDGIVKALENFKKFQDKAIAEHEAALEDLEKNTKAAVLRLATELEGLFFDIFTNQIEKEKNAIQDEINLLELKKQKDIEVADQSITNAAEKADAIAVIEARAEAKKQQLVLRQKQLDIQKARFDKARNIADIVQSTALAVVNALTQVKTLGPGAIALAAIIGAIGAIQIARALAQPIPKYKHGTENHPGGLGIIGDGGKSEGVQLPDGSIYKSPSTATIVDMPKGSKVFPDWSNMRVAATGELQVFDTRAELQAGFSQVVKAIKKIPQPVIQAERAWTRAHKTGSNFRNYLNQRL